MTHRYRTFVPLVVALLLVASATAAGASAAVDTGETTSATVTADAESIEDAISKLEFPHAVGVDKTVTLDATAIVDRSDVSEICWRLNEDEACHDPTFEHTFKETGANSITLIVTDTDGEKIAETRRLQVTDEPTAKLDAPSTASVGEKVTLDAGGSSDDYRIVAYKWDYNDDGEYDTETTKDTLTHRFDTEGMHTVSVTVVDEAGQYDTATAEISVTEADDAVDSTDDANTVVTTESPADAGSGENTETGTDETVTLLLIVGLLGLAGTAGALLYLKQDV